MAQANRITIKVEMAGIYEYTTTFGYRTQHHYIYNMVAEDGTVYVWKTTTFMCWNEYLDIDPRKANFTDRKGRPYDPKKINKGDKITIVASVKGQSEYNGQPQTELTRVTVQSREFAAETYEERMERIQREKDAKKQAQMESIKAGDKIWRMPYKQYKEHYADCETVIDSYEKDVHQKQATIEVIIRAGRLKASGTRFQRYAGYRLKNEEGNLITYRAVCEENAIKRANKEHPDHSWVCVEIY